MKLNPQDLEKISHLTLEHYNQHAEEFWQRTRDHDVSQNIAALLQYIQNEPPFKILDFGCGPGRDLKVFAELGHIAIGLEGAAHLAVMARAYSGCEVWQQSVRKVNMTITLAFLAPDLVKAAIAGQLPHGMGVARLADLPAEWSRQHQMLGLPSQ